MKILIFAPNYLPASRYGGPVRSSHGLAKALVGLGHEVHVFTTNVDGKGELDVPLGEPTDLDGVLVRYFPVQLPRRVYYAPEMGRSIGEEIGSFDVVHTNGMFLWPGPRVARAAISAGIPLVVSPRGMLVPELIAGRSTLIKRAWIGAFERRCLMAASAIHVTSDVEADGVRRLGLDLAPLAIIENGVDGPERLPSREAIEAEWRGIDVGNRVAFLARLDWTKGLDLAISAVRQHPTATLLIAGHDQIGLRGAMENALTRADGSVAARFIGPIEDDRKWAFLAGADVLLAPSVKESFGMSVAEALCLGTPALCTPGVGAASILRRIDPRLVAERNAQALGAALAQLLSDPVMRRASGTLGQEIIASEFCWAAIATRMLDVYTSQSKVDLAAA